MARARVASIERGTAATLLAAATVALAACGSQPPDRVDAGQLKGDGDLWQTLSSPQRNALVGAGANLAEPPDRSGQVPAAARWELEDVRLLVDTYQARRPKDRIDDACDRAFARLRAIRGAPPPGPAGLVTNRQWPRAVVRGGARGQAGTPLLLLVRVVGPRDGGLAVQVPIPGEPLRGARTVRVDSIGEGLGPGDLALSTREGGAESPRLDVGAVKLRPGSFARLNGRVAGTDNCFGFSAPGPRCSLVLFARSLLPVAAADALAELRRPNGVLAPRQARAFAGFRVVLERIVLYPTTMRVRVRETNLQPRERGLNLQQACVAQPGSREPEGCPVLHQVRSGVAFAPRQTYVRNVRAAASPRFVDGRAEVQLWYTPSDQRTKSGGLFKLGFGLREPPAATMVP